MRLRPTMGPLSSMRNASRVDRVSPEFCEDFCKVEFAKSLGNYLSLPYRTQVAILNPRMQIIRQFPQHHTCCHMCDTSLQNSGDMRSGRDAFLAKLKGHMVGLRLHSSHNSGRYTPPENANPRTTRFGRPRNS
ncbi:hypothetical protein L3X38_017982 [Prunus dulcis]|uniref:Uncharacterized protein n=1 Tax=Prunus dulcis TaxID=3755 RepID=A0AAD4ZAB2_PRUDU|nr:hypothetical protein L3X38_017982 [Prunus dulcis]